MNNFELHEQAEQMAVGNSAYKLARRVIELEKSQNKIKAEAVIDCIEECKKEVYYGGAFDMKYMGEYCDINKMKSYANKLETGEI